MASSDYALLALIAYELLYALRSHGVTIVNVRQANGSWHMAHDNKAQTYRLKRVWMLEARS